jgi:RNA polymerase sigma-70 factor (ECF subfamily)
LDDATSHEAKFERLAARIQAGDPAAEEEVVGLFQGRVRAFALSQTRDPGLADELTQETLWAVIRSLRAGMVQEPSRLGAFVWGAARNLLNDRLRSRAKEKLEPLTDRMEFSRPAVEQRDFERQRAARQAIETLEPHERGVLLLSLVDGLAPEQIAVRLGVTYDTVRQRKSRALKKLSELLQPRSQTLRPGLLSDRERP